MLHPCTREKFVNQEIGATIVGAQNILKVLSVSITISVNSASVGYIVVLSIMRQEVQGLATMASLRCLIRGFQGFLMNPNS